jgi:GNAT superfamily N-acetyltransferase
MVTGRSDDRIATHADTLFRSDFARRAGAAFEVALANAVHTPFLRRLLAETLTESVSRVGGDAESIASGPLFELQFEAQRRSFATTYPDAHHYIVSCRASSAAVGRIWIDWTPPAKEPIIGIDVAVLPSARAGAPGLHLLRAWVATCERLGRSARLHVTPDNPARALYRRLGFKETDASALPIPMLREPTATR